MAFAFSPPASPQMPAATMPPNWRYTIGSGFDADAAQVRAADEMNLRTTAENIARMNAAQQNQNAWLANAAQMRAHAQQRQEAADAQALAQQLDMNRSATAAAERARELDVGTQLTKQQQDIERQRFTFQKEQQDDYDRKQLDAIKSSAEFLIPSFREAGKALEDSVQAAKEAEVEADTKAAQLALKLPAGEFKYDKGTKEFVPILPAGKAAMDPKSVEAVHLANEELATARATHATSKMDAQLAQAEYQRLAKEASSAGLLASRDAEGNHVLFSPRHQKTFGLPEKKTEQVPTPAAPDETSVPGYVPPAFRFAPLPGASQGLILPGETSAPSPEPVPADRTWDTSWNFKSPAPLPVPEAPAIRFTDRTGTVWRYVGTDPNPRADKNPDHWVKE